MIYQKVAEGRFIERPNRFIARVQIGDITEICHVKTTGRCEELLIPGAIVYLEEHTDPVPVRKTRFSLIGVQKGDRLINIDSQAPNQAVSRWLEEAAFLPDIQQIKPEYRFGSSRFDFLYKRPARSTCLK